MGGYSNGQLPNSALLPAAGGNGSQYLEAQTARQWAAMVQAASQGGCLLRPMGEADGISSCYRSYANQQYAAANAKRLGIVAASPGYSNHGYGTAVDVDVWTTSFTLTWLRANAAAWGFDNREGASVGESWHWVATRIVQVPDVVTAMTEDDMPTMNEFLNYPAYDGGPSISQVLYNMDQVSNAIFQGGPSLKDSGLSISQTLADLKAQQLAQAKKEAGK